MLRSTILCAFLVTSVPAAASEFNELIRNVPRGANAVMALDVQKAVSSPMGKQNGWDRKLADGAADRPTYFPPEADKVIVAMQADLVRGFDRAWELAIIGLTESIPIRLVARAEGGYVDNINGVDAAWVPSDAYFVEMGKNVLGALSPADRQAVSRWADRAKSGAPMEVTEVLGVALAAMSRGSGAPDMLLALDAQNAVQIHRVRERLDNSGFAAKHSLNLDETAALIASLNAAVLEVKFTDKADATARIEFSKPVSLNNTVARLLVLEALKAMQMELPAVESWKVSVVDKSILLTGELSGDSLRRVMTLMEPPSTKFSSLKDANVETEASGDDMAKNSLAYFKSIDSLLKGLRQKSGSFTSDAYWIDRYASKIDRLPILHVDDDLLKFGENVSETLRVMSGSRKMTNLQGGVASRSDLGNNGTYYNSGYGYGNYSYSSPRTRERNAETDRMNAAASGTAVKVQGWTLIDNATVEIRREMTKRYNIEF